MEGFDYQLTEMAENKVKSNHKINENEKKIILCLICDSLKYIYGESKGVSDVEQLLGPDHPERNHSHLFSCLLQQQVFTFYSVRKFWKHFFPLIGEFLYQHFLILTRVEFLKLEFLQLLDQT